MLRIVNGRPFQYEGPMHEKARCPRIDVRERGTIKSPRAAERKDRRPGWLETGAQSSLMYSGAAPIIDVRLMRMILNVFPFSTGSQCNVSRIYRSKYARILAA